MIGALIHHATPLEQFGATVRGLNRVWRHQRHLHDLAQVIRLRGGLIAG